MDNANAQPQKTWIRPPLGKARMDELFDQIKEGLDRYNKREAEKKQQAGRNRFSGQFSHLRKPTRPAAKSGTTPVASSPPSTSTKTQGGVAADRPYLFASQLTTLTGPGCVYRAPAPKPAPKPMTFAPPTFVLGGSSSSTTDKSASVSLPLEKIASAQGAAAEANGAPDASRPGKRKSSDLETDNPSSSPGCHSSYDGYGYDYGFYPAPMLGQRKWTKEEVAGLVALANKWIPDLKKRRVEE